MIMKSLLFSGKKFTSSKDSFCIKSQIKQRCTQTSASHLFVSSTSPWYMQNPVYLQLACWLHDKDRPDKVESADCCCAHGFASQEEVSQTNTTTDRNILNLTFLWKATVKFLPGSSTIFKVTANSLTIKTKKSTCLYIMHMWGATTLTNQKICENILRVSVCVCSGVKTTRYCNYKRIGKKRGKCRRSLWHYYSPRPGGLSGHGGSGLGDGVWVFSGCTLGTSCSPVAR